MLGFAPVPCGKRPPRASKSTELRYCCVLNKALIAEKHSGTAPAPVAKRPPRVSRGPGLQNRRSLNKILIAGKHAGALRHYVENDRRGPTEALSSDIVVSLLNFKSGGPFWSRSGPMWKTAAEGLQRPRAPKGSFP